MDGLYISNINDFQVIKQSFLKEFHSTEDYATNVDNNLSSIRPITDFVYILEF